MPEPLMLDIKAGTIIKAIAVILGFVFLYLLKEVLVIVFLAIVIASGVSPFANWLEEKKIPRLLGVIVLYVVLFGLVIVMLSLVIPTMAYELNQLALNLPKFFTGLSNTLETAQTSSRYFNILTDIQNTLDSSSKFLRVSSGSVLNFVVGIFGGLISFVAIIVISFYFSVMRQGVAGIF